MWLFWKARKSVIMLCMDAQHTKYVTFKLAHHVVWCPTYRKRILTGKIATFVEQEIRRLCEVNQWVVGALNVQEDHAHLFRESLSRLLLSHRSHLL
jgi:REP element-mobilizing transposase RayT